MNAAPFSAHLRALASEAVALLEVESRLPARAAAALVGLPKWRVYDRWQRTHPGEYRRGKRHITPEMRRTQSEPFAMLCEVMPDCIPSRGGMSSTEVFAATRAEYGNPAARGGGAEAGNRRLWRALLRLVETGRVERRGELRQGSTYRRIA